MDTTATGIMTSSAPPTNHIVGVANSGGGGEALYSSVMPEVPSGYRQQPTQNQVCSSCGIGAAWGAYNGMRTPLYYRTQGVVRQAPIFY